MGKSELPTHWQFAAWHALEGLRRLVRSFDFLALAGQHTYVGAEPSHLVAVIDGFLGDSEGFSASELADLRRLRQVLVEHIRPAYEQGLEAGRRRWREGTRVYGAITTDELRQLALSVAPGDDDSLRGWFAEAFCLAYSAEELESLRGESTA